MSDDLLKSTAAIAALGNATGINSAISDAVKLHNVMDPYASLAETYKRLRSLDPDASFFDAMKAVDAIKTVRGLSSSSSSSSYSPYSFEQSSRRQTQLEGEISTLRTKLKEQESELKAKADDSKAFKDQFATLQATYEDLQSKQDLQHLIKRVHPVAVEKIIEDLDFREQFTAASQSAYIMSVDIRRSTELMLKARTPQLFADFISDLTRRLRSIILDNFGIFDKFTGDGILAFFPEFFSGHDAGFYALRAAAACHSAFAELYAESRKCFSSVPLSAGLGIGLDFGTVQAVRIQDDLTVVGTPVVYACRMGSCRSGATFENQPAYDALFEKYSAFFSFQTEEIDFKHEGLMLAYSVSPNGKLYEAAKPEWQTSSKQGA